MLFFFTAIISLILLMFHVLKQETKNISYDFKTHKDTVNKAKQYQKAVYQYNNDYYQTYTGIPVFKQTDSEGRKWWYYVKTNKPMEYIQRPDMIQNYNTDVIKAREIKKKWFVIENYWDDSIYSIEPFNGSISVYLDDYTIIPNFIEKAKRNKYLFETYKTRNDRYDFNWNKYCNLPQKDKEKIENYFKDNNSHNQKIYCKNMRPYQLSGILNPNSKTNCLSSLNIQYLIRFRKGIYYLDRQNNTYEKEMDELWTDWYAISKEEYKNLTNLIIKNYFDISHTEELMFKHYLKNQYDKVKNNIAFIDGIKELDWSLENAGIKKAFDNKGNFIGEQL